MVVSQRRRIVRSQCINVHVITVAVHHRASASSSVRVPRRAGAPGVHFLVHISNVLLLSRPSPTPTARVQKVCIYLILRVCIPRGQSSANLSLHVLFAYEIYMKFLLERRSARVTRGDGGFRSRQNLFPRYTQQRTAVIGVGFCAVTHRVLFSHRRPGVPCFLFSFIVVAVVAVLIQRKR